MSIYTVFLLKWTDAPRSRDQRLYADRAYYPALLADRYEDPYRLDATGLEDVFERLNLNHPADYCHRSLSVGDVVIVPDGRAFICAGCGWTDVTNTFIVEDERQEP